MYFRSLSTVLQLIVATVAWAAGAASGECSSVSALLSVESSRNATGHWLATVRLDQETQLPSRPSLLLMDVRPTISRCKGVRTDSIIVTLQGPPPPPNPDYEYFPGVGYYKYHKELLTWEDAKKSCESEDAHLLILNSETEASAIKELIQRHTKIAMGIFIGFHDKDKEGQFVTIFGKPLETTGFTRWNAGQPDNAGNNENCGTIHSTTFGLNDYPCNSKSHYICEQIVI